MTRNVDGSQALRAYMEDETNSLKDRQLIFMYFGTFFRANVTMFEVTFGNFTTVIRANKLCTVADSWIPAECHAAARLHERITFQESVSR